MQSISSKIRPSLAASCGWRIKNHVVLTLAPNHLCRRPLWIPNREGYSTKSLLARQFSSGGSKGGGSSSANNRQKQSFFEWYSNKLDTHPILTKSISAGIISAVGSVLGQLIAHQQEQQQLPKDNNGNSESKQKPFELDLVHLSNFALLNVAFVAPVLHHWYNFINRAIPGTSFPRVLQRTICDEGLFSPVYIPAFLGMLWKLEGNTNDNIWKMIKSECPTIIVTEWVSKKIRNSIFFYNHFFVTILYESSILSLKSIFTRHVSKGHVGADNDYHLQIRSGQVSSFGGKCSWGCVEHFSCLCFHQCGI